MTPFISLPFLLLYLYSLTPVATQLGRSESVQPLFACDPPANTFIFCNSSLSPRERSRDLVSRLTLDEKITQLTDSAPAIPRLGLPAYEWWSESLHGVSRHGRGFRFNGTFDYNGIVHYGTAATIRSASMFPQVILSAAAFDPGLWYRIARAIATEARAMYNAGQGKGMTFWAPNINIFRDPRWGRGQETPGEDPLLTSAYAVSYVRGLQGYSFDGKKKMFKYLQASACCKHFTAHDLDNWHGVTRYIFDAKVTKQDMAETFQPPFQSCVKEGRASSIMCAYNRINGVPSCANRDLLLKTAREQWQFDGYITSDCGAVSIIHDSQGYAETPEDAVAEVLNAGMDVECGTYTVQHVKSTIQQKKVVVNVIDQALHNLFSVRMRLGLFDRESSTNNKVFGQIGPNHVCSEEHQALALEAARNGIVLLKNTDNLLPLSKINVDTATLGIIGLNADSPKALLGNYEGLPCKTVTPLQGLKSYIKNIRFHPGCDSAESCSSSVQLEKMVREVEHVVMVMGLDQTQEREKLDRDHLVLPREQEKLIIAVANAAKKPVVLVIMCGGPVDINFAKEHGKIGSILWAGYPGEAGGTAISQIIFGDHNPGGRLPMTWYPQEFVEIPMTDMRMRPDKTSGYPGRTYRFYQGKPVFEFGYGLSFSNYTYKFISVDREEIHLGRPPLSTNGSSSMNSSNLVSVSELESFDICEKEKITVQIEVLNPGIMDGGHAMLLFVRPLQPKDGSPLKQLAGFRRVELKGGEKTAVEFKLNPCDFLSWADENGTMIVQKGTYLLVIGDAEYPLNVKF